MKTAVHENSIIAYDSLPITKRQQEVIDAFKSLGMATDNQIANHLKYTVNRVTGRITELRNRGIIIEASTIKSEFGKPNRVCQLKEKEMLFKI
jgi:predicted ArsR family transcriptional regulator